MSAIKQVIVIRKDLNMRKGKMVAQGAHASLGAYRRAVQGSATANKHAFDWTEGMQTKICVGVDSEDELKSLYTKAQEAGIEASYLVKDAGLTEFKEATYTAVAIGPAPSEEIDKITGALKLL